MKSHIQNIIDNDIAPYLKLHNGSCELISVEDGVVTIRLTGGCSGCPSSKITLFQGILPILQEKVEGIRDVVLD